MSATVIGSIKSIMSLDNSNFVSGLRGASRGLAKTKTDADLAFGAIKLGATAAATALIYSTKQAANFADKMSDVAIVAKGTDMSIESLKSKIIGMSSELGDASKRAEAFRVAITTGMRDMESATEAANVGAKLAIALNTDQEQAVRLVAGAMNAYRNATGDATLSMERLGDMLVQTIRLGDITGQQLVQTLGKVTPMFGEMNVPIEQLLASMVELTKSGVRTFEASTQLRAVMNQMLKPSAELKRSMDNIRISTDGTIESFTSATDLIGEKGLVGVYTVLNHMTDEQKDKLGELIPNIRALAGAMKLSGRGMKDYINTLEQYKDIEDGLDDAFKTKEKTLRTTRNLFKDTAVIVGDPIWKDFKVRLDAINESWSGWLKTLSKEWPQQFQDFKDNASYWGRSFAAMWNAPIAKAKEFQETAKFRGFGNILNDLEENFPLVKTMDEYNAKLRSQEIILKDLKAAKIDNKKLDDATKTFMEYTVAQASGSDKAAKKLADKFAAMFGEEFKNSITGEDLNIGFDEMKSRLIHAFNADFKLDDRGLSTEELFKADDGRLNNIAAAIFGADPSKPMGLAEASKLYYTLQIGNILSHIGKENKRVAKGTKDGSGGKGSVIDSIFDFEEKSITSKFTDRLTSVYDNAITESGYYIDSKNILGKERMLAKTLGMTEKDYLDMRLNNRPKLEAMYNELIEQAQKKVDEMSKKINIGQAIVGNIKATTDLALDSLVGWGELLGKKIDEEIDRISGKISGLESRISTTAAEIERLKSELGIDDKPKTISDMRQELKEKLELMAEMHDLELVGMQEFEEGKYELALAVYEDNKDLLDQEMQDEIDQLEQTLANEEEKARAALATAEAKMAADKLELESEKKKLKEQEKEKEKHLKKMNALDFVAFMAEKATKISEIVFNAAIAIMKIQAAYAAYPGASAIPTAKVKTMAGIQTGLVLSQPWVPRYAEGTGNHPGGSALVGEEGPEIVNLPRGSSVIPHKQSMAALNNQGTTYNFVFNNPVVDNNDRMEDLVDTIERRLGSRMRGIA